MAFVDNGHTYMGTFQQFLQEAPMPRAFINPPEIAAPGNNYNHVVKAGNTVYISGQVSRDLDGKTTQVGDPEAQIRETWANLEIEAKAVGVYHNNQQGILKGYFLCSLAENVKSKTHVACLGFCVA